MGQHTWTWKQDLKTLTMLKNTSNTKVWMQEWIKISLDLFWQPWLPCHGYFTPNPANHGCVWVWMLNPWTQQGKKKKKKIVSSISCLAVTLQDARKVWDVIKAKPILWLLHLLMAIPPFWGGSKHKRRRRKAKGCLKITLIWSFQIWERKWNSSSLRTVLLFVGKKK